MAPRPGERAPDFAVKDHAGKTVRLADLAGRRVLLWFYAEDGTPACTGTAVGFRDAAKDLEALGIDVVGVSADPPARHAAFRAAERLGYALLSDPDHAVAARYGAWGEKTLYGRKVTGVIRSTFLLGPDGVVEKAWTKVRAKGHVERVVQELKAADPAHSRRAR